jgi:hypothetical protein
MKTINASSTAWLSIAFKDKTGTPVVPTAATYKINSLDTGAVVLASTAILALSSSIELEITKEQNAILNIASALERRRVTIVASYGVGDQMTQEYDYALENVPYI